LLYDTVALCENHSPSLSSFFEFYAIFMVKASSPLPPSKKGRIKPMDTGYCNGSAQQGFFQDAAAAPPLATKNVMDGDTQYKTLSVGRVR